VSMAESPACGGAPQGGPSGSAPGTSIGGSGPGGAETQPVDAGLRGPPPYPMLAKASSDPQFSKFQPVPTSEGPRPPAPSHSPYFEALVTVPKGKAPIQAPEPGLKGAWSTTGKGSAMAHMPAPPSEAGDELCTVSKAGGCRPTQAFTDGSPATGGITAAGTSEASKMVPFTKSMATPEAMGQTSKAAPESSPVKYAGGQPPMSKAESQSEEARSDLAFAKGSQTVQGACKAALGLGSKGTQKGPPRLPQPQGGRLPGAQREAVDPAQLTEGPLASTKAEAPANVPTLPQPAGGKRTADSNEGEIFAVLRRGEELLRQANSVSRPPLPTPRGFQGVAATAPEPSTGAPVAEPTAAHATAASPAPSPSPVPSPASSPALAPLSLPAGPVQQKEQMRQEPQEIAAQLLKQGEELLRKVQAKGGEMAAEIMAPGSASGKGNATPPWRRQQPPATPLQSQAPDGIPFKAAPAARPPAA